MEKNYNKEYLGLIYKATNKATGQSYIGATTHTIKQRKLDHNERAMREEDGKFQNAIATYGIEAFDWTLIDTAYSANDLAEKEKHYIYSYFTKEEGYNTDSGGGFQKEIYQYDIYTGTLTNTFDKLEEAATSVGGTKQDISRACLSVNKRFENYYWSYTYQEPFEPGKDSRRRRVYQYSLDGELLAEYKSVSEASRQTEISKTCISRVCRGERNHTKGFIFMYD